MKKAFRPAFTATIPVLCGYLFIGFAFGVMLRDIGFGSIWSFFYFFYNKSLKRIIFLSLQSFRNKQREFGVDDDDDDIVM